MYKRSEEARKATARVNKAIKAGALVRPESCELCDRSKPVSKNVTYGWQRESIIVAHHFKGYGSPLEVWWICQSCNVLLGSQTGLTKEQAQQHVEARRQNPEYLRTKRYAASNWERELLFKENN